MMSDEILKWFYKDIDFKRYKGYRLSAIDGSLLEIDNTEELRKEFGYVRNQSIVVARIFLKVVTNAPKKDQIIEVKHKGQIIKMRVIKLKLDCRETADKELKHEYKVNTDILVGKLKISLVVMLLTKSSRKRAKILNNITSEISKSINSFLYKNSIGQFSSSLNFSSL